MFLELLGLGEKCEQRITESLTESFWELYSVIWLEELPNIVAQCGATPASVAATPPCSATPFQRQLDVRHSWQLKDDRCDRVFQGELSATPLQHLKNPMFLGKSAATRDGVARQEAGN